MLNAPFAPSAKLQSGPPEYRSRRAGLEGGAHNPTLAEALDRLNQNHLSQLRSHSTSYSQARTATNFVAALVLQEMDAGLAATSNPLTAAAIVRVGDVSADHVATAVQHWRNAKLSPTTINRRRDSLNAMGVAISGKRIRRPRRVKWWLKPDVEAKLVANLRKAGNDLMADYITWATRTGLRVEESLRLTRADFTVSAERISVSVPGTKTSMSQATLPLSAEAVEIFHARFTSGAAPSTLMFPIGYQGLKKRWMVCRAMIGAGDDSLATLKALRRSAARYLHVSNGMPLDLVRSYLRHENIATTMEYLRLTGGYGADEYARWL